MKGGKVEAIAAPSESDDSDSDSDDETTKKIKGAIVEISDAELFKRCGGLTGHKGNQGHPRPMILCPDPQSDCPFH